MKERRAFGSLECEALDLIFFITAFAQPAHVELWHLRRVHRVPLSSLAVPAPSPTLFTRARLPLYLRKARTRTLPPPLFGTRPAPRLSSAWRIMRVGTADINVDDLVNQIKARNMAKSKRVRTPNCTHVDMDRVYGRDQQCYVCGREPSIGFLYECRQDSEAQSLHDLLEQEDEDPMEVVKTDMRLQLEWAGLSESVIRTAEQGHYTTAQLELLKAQKQELRQVISDTLQANQINNAVSKLVAMEQAPPNHDGTGVSKIKDAVSGKSQLRTYIEFRLAPKAAEHPADTLLGPTSVRFQSLSHLSFLLPRPRLHLVPGRPQC